MTAFQKYSKNKPVMPAKAGIHFFCCFLKANLDSRFRGNDK